MNDQLSRDGKNTFVSGAQIEVIRFEENGGNQMNDRRGEPWYDQLSRDGKITFVSGAQIEVIRFEENGDCYVRGEKVDNNLEIYREFCEWLADARRIEPSK